MNSEPIEVLQFEKIVDGRTVTCDVERFQDGSVGVFGDDIDTWMFEFTSDALQRAIKQVESEGYVPSRTAENRRDDGREPRKSV